MFLNILSAATKRTAILVSCKTFFEAKCGRKAAHLLSYCWKIVSKNKLNFGHTQYYSYFGDAAGRAIDVLPLESFTIVHCGQECFLQDVN